MSNFRVAVEVPQDEGGPKTYYILINTSKLKTIRDVEYHIKEKLKIPSQFLLSIGNVFLPSEESVELIEPTDILKVNFSNTVFIKQTRLLEQEATPAPPKPKKKKPAPYMTSGLGDVLSFLRKDVEKIEEVSQPASIIASSVGDESEEEMEVGDNLPGDGNGDVGPARRKRKRRPRRKSRVPEDSQITPPTKDNFVYTEERTKSGSHIFFDEAQPRSVPVSSTPETPKVRKSPVLNGKDDDWKQRLLSNANVAPSQKTYYRTKVSSCFEDLDVGDVDPFKYPVLTEPKPNQVVAFKVLKMDHNYTPQMSSLIVASVTEVDGVDLTFRILRGKEEFAEPTGKFSFEESSESLKDSVSLRLDELIQPRVIKP